MHLTSIIDALPAIEKGVYLFWALCIALAVGDVLTRRRDEP